MIDITKPVKTRDGRAVTELREIESGIQGGHKSLLIGRVAGTDGFHLWYPWGAFHHEREHELDISNETNDTAIGGEG